MEHQYRVTELAAGCTAFEQDQLVQIYVEEPAPGTYTVPAGKPCAGTVMVLDEDDE